MAIAKGKPQGDESALLHSSVAGRTDHLQTKVPAGAYVIPADVVSGTGQGNTMAGAKIILAVIKAGPDGTGQDVQPVGRASGGAAQKGEQVPIMAAGGELVISPRDVAKWGAGDVVRGHKMLDKWVVNQRKKIIAEMSKLPGPVKD